MIFIETELNERQKEKFEQILKFNEIKMENSIKKKDGLYLFYNSMCYMCGIHDEFFYFSYDENIVRYCYTEYGERKCSQFNGSSDVIKRVLSIDYENYPLIIADWGKYQSDFDYSYIYTLKRYNGIEKINLFFNLDRCIGTRCETKKDNTFIPPKYITNAFIHDLVKLYLKAEMNFNEGLISQELRNTFISLFLKKYIISNDDLRKDDKNDASGHFHQVSY